MWTVCVSPRGRAAPAAPRTPLRRGRRGRIQDFNRAPPGSCPSARHPDSPCIACVPVSALPGLPAPRAAAAPGPSSLREYSRRRARNRRVVL